MLIFSINKLDEIPNNKLHQLFIKLAKKITTYLNIKNKLYFDLSFINASQMKKINKGKETDVLSFALNDNDSSNLKLLGEIFIDIDYAQHEAKRLNCTIEYELSMLYVHGILHLLGYDHYKENDKKKMFSIQNKMLKYI